MLSRGGTWRGGVLAVAASLMVGFFAGCGQEDESAPPACLGSATAYLDALKAAPEPVLLDGSTPISDCLVPDQAPAQLAQVGERLVAVASRLNAAARRDPSGDATVELGYLVGAAQQGAADSGGTEGGGIHTDLLRRLDAAARFSKAGRALPTNFERAFGEGYAAGQESG
jgi:hypothetical protein